jgi:hypothetical protein
MSLSVGVLMIGSLYWDEVRARWRADRFRSDIEFLVEAPIRYGRLSSSGTYTMVFSPSVPQMGTAKVLKCAHSIEDPNDLINEAECLWTAERRQQRGDGTISSTWGCVALLVSPFRQTPEDFLEAWAERVSGDPQYGQFQYSPLEGPIVNTRGILQIEWPRLLESSDPLPLDLLVAPSNEPSFEGDARAYPSAETIAFAWKRSSEQKPEDKRESYFWKNRKARITTFQDNAIEQILDNRGGCFS